MYAEHNCFRLNGLIFNVGIQQNPKFQSFLYRVDTSLEINILNVYICVRYCARRTTSLEFAIFRRNDIVGNQITNRNYYHRNILLKLMSFGISIKYLRKTQFSERLYYWERIYFPYLRTGELLQTIMILYITKKNRRTRK